MKFKNRFKVLIFVFVVIMVLIICLNLKFKKDNMNDKITAFLEYPKVNLTSSLMPRNSLKDNFYNESTNLNEFYRIHEQNLNSNLPRIALNLARAEVGYANRLYSVISTILVSILTDSALVICWPHIDHFIKPPISIFVNCTSFAHSFIEPNSSKLKVYTLKAQQAWLLNKDLNKLILTKIPDTSRFFLNSSDALFMEICMNPIYYKKLQYYGLISNDALQMEQNKFFLGFLVGGALLNKFWIPNNDLNRKIQFYLNKYFKDNFVIGIQLRYGDSDLLYLNEQIDTIKFINCALKIEKTHSEKRKKFKWFISSDSQVNLDKLLRKYPSKAFSTLGTLAHISLDPNGYERAIIDNELLSKVDELIITGASTFGFVASMKSKRLPYFIDGSYSKSSHRECIALDLNPITMPQTPLGFILF
jgi:hypothetical protein